MLAQMLVDLALFLFILFLFYEVAKKLFGNTTDAKIAKLRKRREELEALRVAKDQAELDNEYLTEIVDIDGKIEHLEKEIKMKEEKHGTRQK